jgi:hypothetical protein
MPGAAQFIDYGPNAAQQGLSQAEAFNAAQSPTSPAAVGSVPAPVNAQSTASQVVPQAISAGNSVYNQLPQYNASLGNIGANINAETSGQLPADVLAQIQQQAAERGVATGSPGSPNANAAYLRSLGLTSLDLTNMGQQNLTSILPTLPGASIANNPGFYLTPGEQYNAQLENSFLAAAPNPSAAAAANLRSAGQGFGTGLGAASGGLPPPQTTIPGSPPAPGMVTASGPPGYEVFGGQQEDLNDLLARYQQQQNAAGLPPDQADQADATNNAGTPADFLEMGTG